MATTREYFYSIDGKGRLFHDGTELTDEKFLNFFLKRLRVNDTAAHPEYPFVSPCGQEMNYVQCADRVIVFDRLVGDHLAEHQAGGRLYYGPELFVDFEPERLRFSPEGRVYHPAPVGDFGAIGPALLLELAPALRPWGPYYAFDIAERTFIIEPLEPEPRYLVVRPRPDNGCFGCGGAHARGLALSFLFDRREKSTRTWFTPDARLQGAPGWMHGGFVSLLLDEIMAKVLHGLEVGAPTVNLNVNFRKPCRLGRNLELRGALRDVQGRKHMLEGRILDVTDEEEILLADATGLFLKIDGKPGIHESPLPRV